MPDDKHENEYHERLRQQMVEGFMLEHPGMSHGRALSKANHILNQLDRDNRNRREANNAYQWKLTRWRRQSKYGV